MLSLRGNIEAKCSDLTDNTEVKMREISGGVMACECKKKKKKLLVFTEMTIEFLAKKKKIFRDICAMNVFTE
jgi:hypothetical protein